MPQFPSGEWENFPAQQRGMQGQTNVFDPNSVVRGGRQTNLVDPNSVVRPSELQNLADPGSVVRGAELGQGNAIAGMFADPSATPMFEGTSNEAGFLIRRAQQLGQQLRALEGGNPVDGSFSQSRLSELNNAVTPLVDMWKKNLRTMQDGQTRLNPKSKFNVDTLERVFSIIRRLEGSR
jgi:hypothetical protein